MDQDKKPTVFQRKNHGVGTHWRLFGEAVPMRIVTKSFLEKSELYQFSFNRNLQKMTLNIFLYQACCLYSLEVLQ